MKQFETVTFKGTAVHTNGMMPQKGEMAPDFTAVAGDLSDLSLGSLKGKRVILNIFPSLDTSVCATSVRKFNVKAAHLENVQVLAVSMDLPFAQTRWCGTAGIDKVIMLSDYKNRDFGKNYGVYIKEIGLLARSIFVIDENNKVVYAEYCSEVSSDPDYDSALNAAKNL